MDVLVRNRKTGQEKKLPENVARMMKSEYIIVSEAKDTIIKPTESVNSPNLPEPPKVEVEEKSVVIAENDEELESLRKEYEEKLGSKPHGRMKKESLLKALGR